MFKLYQPGTIPKKRGNHRIGFPLGNPTRPVLGTQSKAFVDVPKKPLEGVPFKLQGLEFKTNSTLSTLSTFQDFVYNETKGTERIALDSKAF